MPLSYANKADYHLKQGYFLVVTKLFSAPLLLGKGKTHSKGEDALESIAQF